MTNQLAKSINSLMSDKAVVNRFNEILGEKSQGFISSVLNVVKNNKMLATADPKSILNAAVVAATLDLPIDPNLGFSAIVPYKEKGNPVAQFQMMYKGFVQLAQRSGQYQTINACEIYEGELKSENRITGEYEFDFTAKTSTKIIGYAAYFKLINGFTKTVYWPVEKVEKHAKRFSKVYQKGYGLWADKNNGGFESMALKTVIKHIISKFGPLSIDYQMAKAIKVDQAVMLEGGTDDDVIYIDNPDESEAETTQAQTEVSEPKARRAKPDDKDPEGIINFENQGK